MTDLKTHWKAFVVLATVIGFVASVITINNQFHPLIITSATITNQPNFDFSLQGNWGSQHQAEDCYFHSIGYKYPVYLTGELSTPQISVTPMSGTPQPVRLYVESLPSQIASVSFSVETATPPFTSQMTIVPSNAPPGQPSLVVYVTIAAESSGIIRTITIPISLYVCQIV